MVKLTYDILKNCMINLALPQTLITHTIFSGKSCYNEEI